MPVTVLETTDEMTFLERRRDAFRMVFIVMQGDVGSKVSRNDEDLERSEDQMPTTRTRKNV